MQQGGKAAVAATGGGRGVPKKAAKSIDLGRAGLYDDKEAPDNNTQDQASAAQSHGCVSRLEAAIHFARN